MEADWGSEGWVLELRKDWKERWEVVGRENENTMVIGDGPSCRTGARRVDVGI
jgi:hypothetical protein